MVKDSYFKLEEDLDDFQIFYDHQQRNGSADDPPP